MTVIYDRVEGHLIGVETGRTADVFSGFPKQIPAETVAKIPAVAMGMGPSCQQSVRDCWPNADLVFDRFHVMKNYSKALSNQRRIECRKATKAGQELLTGTPCLVLKNAAKPDQFQTQTLHRLLDDNASLNTLYILKEQLQTWWEAETVELMQDRLEAWCRIADQSTMLYLKTFATSLRSHRVGLCNYAKLPAHQCQNRGWQHQYRHAPQARQRHQGC